MKTFLSLLFVFAVPAMAVATDNYEYGPDEYVTITKGISPDGKLAITAHGDGKYGYEHFQLNLTDAHTGRKIGPLEEIQKILDTGAASYVAKWSEDSNAVTIVWRWSRHDPILSITYRIEGRRALPLTRAPVDSDYLGTYWSDNCSRSRPTLRRFGTPKER